MQTNIAQPMNRRGSHKSNRSTGNAKTLERRYYVDREIWESERQRIFLNHWLLLGHCSDLSVDRSFVTGKLAGGPVLVVRDCQGQWRGFHNVCRHRGAMIEERAQGKLDRDVLLCPYHGWTYELCGHLVGAPNMADNEGFDRSQWGLKPIKVRAWEGWILGSVEIPSSEQEMAIKALGERIAPWGCAGLVRVARLEYKVEANWKIIFENYSECYHCPLVHPRLNRLTPYTESENFFQSGSVLGGPMSLADGVETMSMTGRGIAAPLKGLTAEARRQVMYFTIFPSFFLSLHPDYVMVHRLTPCDVDQTDVACEFYVEPAAAAAAGFDASPAVEFWDMTNRQDWHVCELVQRGARSSAFEPGPMSNLESVVAAFDRHYLALMGHQ